MECNHGLVSFDHSVAGTLRVDGRRSTLMVGAGTASRLGQVIPGRIRLDAVEPFDTAGISFVRVDRHRPLAVLSVPGFIVGSITEGNFHQSRHVHGSKTTE